jgi:hypothetical protein
MLVFFNRMEEFPPLFAHYASWMSFWMMPLVVSALPAAVGLSATPYTTGLAREP